MGWLGPWAPKRVVSVAAIGVVGDLLGPVEMENSDCAVQNCRNIFVLHVNYLLLCSAFNRNLLPPSLALFCGRSRRAHRGYSPQ